MFENVSNFFKKVFKKEMQKESHSGKEAKERLHLVLMQDRANVSADFLEMMKQEIIEVIKKYIDVDENSIDVRLTNQPNEDGTNGAPALYANIPIISIKEEKQNAEEIETEKEEVQEQLDNNENKTENIKSEDKENNNETQEVKHTLIESSTEEKIKQQEESKE